MAYSILSVVLVLVLWVSYVVLHGIWSLVGGLVWRTAGLILTPE